MLTSILFALLLQTMSEARQLLAAHDYAAAKKSFLALTAAKPDDGTAWLGLGMALGELGEYDAAVAALHNALERGAPHNVAAYELARVEARSGNRAAALAAVRDIHAPAPAAAQSLATAPEFAALRADAEFAKAVDAIRPCTAAEFRQFDFWIGSWNVVAADGHTLGKNTITSVHGGCVIQEQWTSAAGTTGSSMSLFDPRTKKWHQFWADSTGLAWLSYDKDGNPATMRGTFHDGVMEMLSDPATQPRLRGTWTPLPDGRVRQAFDRWDEASKSWQTSFEGFYVRQ